MLREQRLQFETLQETVDQVQKDLAKIKQDNGDKAFPEIPDADEVAAKVETLSAPQEVKQPWPLPPGGAAQTNLPPHPQQEPQIIGEISVLSNPSVVTEGMDSQGNKKKDGRFTFHHPLWRPNC